MGSESSMTIYWNINEFLLVEFLNLYILQKKNVILASERLTADFLYI